MSINRIDFLLACRSQYHVLDHLCTKMYEAFCRAGFNCRLLEMNGALQKIGQDPPDLTICFNGIPRVPRPGTHALLCDFFLIPHLACLVDPPYRFRSALGSKYLILSCDDKSGCDYLNGKNFELCTFMPHAVEREMSPDHHIEPIYDVTLLATFLDFEVRRFRWRLTYPPVVSSILEKAADLTFSDETTSFISAFQQMALEHNDELESLPQKVNYPELYSELELYVKGRDRAELVKSIRDAEVHIFGSGIQGYTWKRYLGRDHPNIIVHEGVDYPEALQIMKKSKIVVNCNIKNKYGAHERIFAGMACGALVLTNENPYLKEYFQDGQSILYYQNGHKGAINQKVTEFLKDDTKRMQAAARGREIVMQHHTWDNRAAELKAILEPFLQKIKDRFTR